MFFRVVFKKNLVNSKIVSTFATDFEERYLRERRV